MNPPGRPSASATAFPDAVFRAWPVMVSAARLKVRIRPSRSLVTSPIVRLLMMCSL